MTTEFRSLAANATVPVYGSSNASTFHFPLPRPDEAAPVIGSYVSILWDSGAPLPPPPPHPR
jgi:hypothetical protein